MNLPNADFIKEVERMVEQDGMTYIEAIVNWCEAKNIEIESMSSVISNNSLIKAKVQLEAENLHFLPKSIRLSL